MKHRIVMFLLLCIALLTVACGGETTTPEEPVAEPAAAQPAAPELTELSEEEAAAFAAALDPANAQGQTAEGCEEYFRFCVTSTLTGSVEATATAGVGANIDSCEAWAAPGEARILELPMMLSAGEDLITVALTRIGAYTGPGQYELAAFVNEGMPDMFPAIQVGGRAFNNGDGSAATVTLNADGSGSVVATDLVEIASVQVSNPDPNARVDFAMQWTCQEN